MADDNILIKAAYVNLRSLQMAGFNTWLGRGKVVLERYNLLDHWFDESLLSNTVLTRI